MTPRTVPAATAAAALDLLPVLTRTGRQTRAHARSTTDQEHPMTTSTVSDFACGDRVHVEPRTSRGSGRAPGGPGEVVEAFPGRRTPSGRGEVLVRLDGGRGGVPAGTPRLVDAALVSPERADAA